MEMIPIKSSNIEAIGHDPEKNELCVKFQGGGTYFYSGFSAEDFALFRGSSSKGSFFAKNIRGLFPSRKG